MAGHVGLELRLAQMHAMRSASPDFVGLKNGNADAAGCGRRHAGQVADWLAHAFDTGVMWTPFGWECRTGITEFNARSIANFPVQASEQLMVAWLPHPSVQIRTRLNKMG